MRNVPVDTVDDLERAVLAIATDYPPRHVLPAHQHRRAQLLYSATGLMQVDTADGTWTVPPQRAVLIPPAATHRVRMDGARTRSLYLEPAAVPWFPLRCQVIDVCSLLRELLHAAIDIPADDPPSGRDATLIELLLHEIQAATPLPFELPMPGAGPLLRRCQAFAAAPAIHETPQQWANCLGLSVRTFNRAFLAQTGVTFQQWRLRAIVLHAIRLLSTGKTVTQSSAILGYGTPAAFSTMFRKHTGTTPYSYLSALRRR